MQMAEIGFPAQKKIRVWDQIASCKLKFCCTARFRAIQEKLMDRRHSLAEHVLVNILICLPAMSLLRFKVVCKYWCSLIESPAFISKHVAHNRNNNKEDNFIVLGRVYETRLCEPKFALLSGSQYEECVYDIDNGKFWYPDNVYVFLVGCCDGIVCLKHRGEIALWNPAIKQVRRIPSPSFSDRLLKEKALCFTSFGADLKSNNYKIVSIMIVYEDSEHYLMVGNQVELYNLRDDSWRIIYKDDILPFHEIFTVDAVSSSKSGMCFWLASYYNRTTMLLSFDFSDDVFRTMRLPDEGVLPSDLYIDLLDDKVVFMVQKANGNAKYLDIWILHESGVKESWSMMYKVGPFFLMDGIFPRFSKNGEFLICSKSYTGVRNKLYLYNLHTQQGNYIQSCNIEVTGPGQLIRYSASLISLKKSCFTQKRKRCLANTVI